MRIANNISAMNTQRVLTGADNAVSKSMERLSSGFRINRAADDAAGLAISEKMRAQIRGLNQASSNAQDGISMIQTAEGGMNEIHSILQRMRELAVQAGNGTLTDADKGEIQKEINQLVEEVDRISNDTEFNTKKLLNGEAGVASSAQNGTASGAITVNGTSYADGTTVSTADMGEAVDQIKAGSDTQTGVYGVTVTAAATGATVGDAAAYGTAVGGTLKINGVSISVSAGDSLATVKSKINNVSNQTGVTAASGTTNGGIKLTSNEVGSSETVSIQGDSANFLIQLGLQAGTGTATALTAAGTDAAGTITTKDSSGSVQTRNLTGNGNKLTLDSSGDAADGIEITIDSSEITLGTNGLKFDAAVDPNGEVTLQIGANSQQNLKFSISDMGTAALGIDNLDVTEDADAALDAIDTALDAVSAERSKLGAYQNRLEHTISNLGVSAENITASESRIRDVDMAQEMTTFTKNQILIQASTAMLAQANQKSQSVLKLLG